VAGKKKGSHAGSGGTVDSLGGQPDGGMDKPGQEKANNLAHAQKKGQVGGKRSETDASVNCGGGTSVRREREDSSKSSTVNCKRKETSGSESCPEEIRESSIKGSG